LLPGGLQRSQVAQVQRRWATQEVRSAVGKAKRIRQQRRTAGDERRTVVVDSCEVGQHAGSLTLRVGNDEEPPVCVAIPAPMAIDLLQQMRTASIDAEEGYWQIVPVIMRGIEPGDGAGAAARMRAWLPRQGWANVLRRVPAEHDDAFLVSHVGHVGLAIGPPFTDRRTLAIFDPMQLRRLTPSLQSALAAASCEPPPASPHVVTATLAFLAAQRWPAGNHQDPTIEQTRAEAQRRYQQFLARNPYIRPEENNVPT
jgi:hypothetical protein